MYGDQSEKHGFRSEKGFERDTPTARPQPARVSPSDSPGPTHNPRAMMAALPSKGPSQAAGVPSQDVCTFLWKDLSPAEDSRALPTCREDLSPPKAAHAQRGPVSKAPRWPGRSAPHPQMVPQLRGRSPVWLRKPRPVPASRILRRVLCDDSGSTGRRGAPAGGERALFRPWSAGMRRGYSCQLPGDRQAGTAV